MDRFRSSNGMWWAASLALLVFGIWSQHFAHSATLADAIEAKTVALSPTHIVVSTTTLAGQLEDLAVTTRVEKTTGKLVEGPELLATLRLRNTTEDQAILLLSGVVDYLDARGAIIPLTKSQGTAEFSFFPEQQGDVLPGQDASQAVRVPFPTTALKARTLRDIRLRLTYRATPYRHETVEGAVALSG